MRIIHISLIAASLLGLFACQKSDGFLDKKSTAELNEAVVFADSARTIDFLTGLYAKLSFNVTFGSGNTRGDFSKMSDEAEGRYPAAGNFDKLITQGSFAGGFYSEVLGEWSTMYGAVRHANIFLKNVDNSPLSAALRARMKAESRLLRAYFYFYLVRYFGGVPLMDDNVFKIDDVVQNDRAAFADCVDYIVSELDEIAPQLPLDYQGLQYGRVTRGAALALKSRILLLAASPLFNGGSFAEPGSRLEELVSYPSYDQNRWEQARLAAKAVMDLNKYALMIDNDTRPGNGFYQVFLTRMNNEFILYEPKPPGRQFEASHNPYSRGGRNYYYYPTQELVDWFPMANGLPITDPASGYNPNNPYVNRDPRFNYTVIYNGAQYWLQSASALRPVYTYAGAGDGLVPISNNSRTITGYYVRKFCSETTSQQSGGGNTEGSVSLIRYAEILLNYAEAANEMGQTADAMNQLIALRERAGIQPGLDNRYGLPANPTQEEARKLIWNERAIELAFENHRYFDVRRWKRGEEFDGKYVHGMRITQANDNAPPSAYERFQVRTRYFKNNIYLFPIPESETVLNLNMLQNPGW